MTTGKTIALTIGPLLVKSVKCMFHKGLIFFKSFNMLVLIPNHFVGGLNYIMCLKNI